MRVGEWGGVGQPKATGGRVLQQPDLECELLVRRSEARAHPNARADAGVFQR
jgi:hypothetical protein